MATDNIFYKVVCLEVDALYGVTVWEDSNCGTIDEVHEFVKLHIDEHPNAEWQLFPMQCKMLTSKEPG